MTLISLPFLLGSVHAQGYRVTDDAYVIDRIEDWMGWRLPKSAAVATRDGAVRPFRVRRGINALGDADRYVHQVAHDMQDDFPFRRLWEGGLGLYGRFYIVSGGLKNAGSNMEDAPNVVDGDPTTYWEPDPADSLSKWWIEVDLGRAVTATKIFVRFVETGYGDPFKRFKVLTSTGVPVTGVAAMDWAQAFSSRESEDDRRTFEITLGPPRESEGDGDVIQYVRVQAIERSDKGRQVSRGEYEVLPPEQRGIREYFRKTERGGVRLVSEEVYEALPIKQRGAVRYYTRPHPRLAEIEVWTVGNNITLGLLERGGSVDNPATAQPLEERAVADGSYLSSRRVIPRTDTPVSLILDLGAIFWADEIRLIGDRVIGIDAFAYPLSSYRIDVSDGTRTPDGKLAWEILTPEARLNIPGGLWRTQDHFDLRRLRYIRISLFSLFATVSAERGPYSHTLREVQVYGEGYISDVTLKSPLIDLGPNRALSFVRWAGWTPPGTAIEISTRTGDRLKEVKRYFDIDGREITARRWHDLPGFLRIPPVVEEVPGDDWSAWSAPYRHSGELIRSPTPSRYLKVQVRLISDAPDRFASINSLSVGYFTPLVYRATGEIAPRYTRRAGEPELFSLFVKMTAMPENLGFDGILLTSPYDVDLDFQGVRMGDEQRFMNGDARDLSPGEFTLVPTQSDSIRLRFPRTITPIREDLLEIRFTSTIILKGTRFRAFLYNSSLPNSPQEVRPGDATSLVDSQRMTILVPIDRKVLGDVKVSPNPFTPNGDGINDLAQLSFDVFNIDVDVPVEVIIYDLNGRALRRLVDRRPNVSGEHIISWDGRDDRGALVPPGIYLARVSVDAKARTAERTARSRIIYLAY